MSSSFKPVAYLKSDCPFCFKLVMFLAEAGLMDKVELVRIEGTDEAAMNHYRELLQQKTREKASFPTVQLDEDSYSSDSEGLIQMFADQYQIDAATLPGLAYYKDNLFPAYIARFKELKALRAQVAES